MRLPFTNATLALLTSLGVGLLAAAPASAAFHLWDVTEVYSNADGSVQFVEFFTNADFQDELFGHDVTSTANTYTIPHDLGAADPQGNPNGGGNNATANTYFLIGTPGYKSLADGSGGSLPQPDYVFTSDGFFAPSADTVTLVNVDSLAWTSGELPTDGSDSLNEDFGGTNRRVAVNSPTNFDGATGSIQPVTSVPALPPFAAATLLGLLPLAGGRQLGRTRSRRAPRSGSATGGPGPLRRCTGLH